MTKVTLPAGFTIVVTGQAFRLHGSFLSLMTEVGSADAADGIRLAWSTDCARCGDHLLFSSSARFVNPVRLCLNCKASPSRKASERRRRLKKVA